MVNFALKLVQNERVNESNFALWRVARTKLELQEFLGKTI